MSAAATMRRGDRRAGVPAVALAFLVLAGALHAGPHVLMELNDGRKVSAELYGFVNGRFFLRDLASGKQEDIAESEVRSVSFGQQAEFTRPELNFDPSQPLTAADIRRMAERREFPMLLFRLQTVLNRQGRAAVEKLEGDLGRELDRTDLPGAGRVDLELGRIAVRVLLGEHERAQLDFIRLRRDHKDEPAVKQFGKTMEWLRARSADRPGERRKPTGAGGPGPGEGVRNAPPQ